MKEVIIAAEIGLGLIVVISTFSTESALHKAFSIVKRKIWFEFGTHITVFSFRAIFQKASTSLSIQAAYRGR